MACVDGPSDASPFFGEILIWCENGRVSGLFVAAHAAGPDGFRDPLPNGISDLAGHHPTRALWIVGSTDQHLRRFNPAPVASRALHAWAGAVGR